MDLESVPKDVWQKAEERAVLLRPLAALDEAPAHLVRVAAIDLQISERWAYRLIRRLREENGAVTALLPCDGRGAPRKSRIEGDRDAIISQVIEGRYLKRQKVRPSEVVKTVQVECRKAGVSPPSEASIRRRINRIDKGVASRLREDDPCTKPTRAGKNRSMRKLSGAWQPMVCRKPRNSEGIRQEPVLRGIIANGLPHASVTRPYGRIVISGYHA
jgi:putative transposase